MKAFLTCAITITSACVICANSAIHSVLLLILTFALASVYLLLLGVEFLALVYILVYIGAIAVLFLFIVMMLNLRAPTGFSHFPLLLGFSTIVSLTEIFSKEDQSLNLTRTHDIITLNINYIHELDNMKLLGIYLYTVQPLAIILIGFILLVAMIGAILYTIQHSPGIKRTNVVFYTRQKHDVLRIIK